MGRILSATFSISLYGSIVKAATITAPSNNYLEDTPHALVKNELFIFGGWSDKQKIAKLEGCQWKEQSAKLINEVSYFSAALMIENGEKALICFDDHRRKKCEIFDGETSSSTHGTKVSHSGGKLGFYKGKPITVGSSLSDAANKVETLNSHGWSSLADFPVEISHHVLMGLPSGNLLLAGGGRWISYKWIKQKRIWLLKNNNWNKIGDLQYADDYGSAIMIRNSIFIVAGDLSPNAIQRLDFEGDELVNQKVIGNTGFSRIPVLFEVSPDYCI